MDASCHPSPIQAVNIQQIFQHGSDTRIGVLDNNHNRQAINKVTTVGPLVTFYAVCLFLQKHTVVSKAKQSCQGVTHASNTSYAMEENVLLREGRYAKRQCGTASWIIYGSEDRSQFHWFYAVFLFLQKVKTSTRAATKAVTMATTANAHYSTPSSPRQSNLVKIRTASSHSSVAFEQHWYTLALIESNERENGSPHPYLELKTIDRIYTEEHWQHSSQLASFAGVFFSQSHLSSTIRYDWRIVCAPSTVIVFSISTRNIRTNIHLPLTPINLILPYSNDYLNQLYNVRILLFISRLESKNKGDHHRYPLAINSNQSGKPVIDQINTPFTDHSIQ
ncbi:hypothetical protein TrispH2_010053 [Trichoplax sp. H2]|nr:hypothetical protein TrispH2_010053 [Trichoplax sp. H2]|eukprot:RDD37725.1 hypothetical protein TrispH2_010053 [Trichoplax sp. H2]